MKLIKYIVAIAMLCAVTFAAQAQVSYTNRYAVTLAWDASPSPAITNYTVYYGVSSGTYTNSVLAGTNLTATVSNLLAVTTYYFAATATDAFGMESDMSNEVAYTTPRPKPLPPGNFRRNN